MWATPIIWSYSIVPVQFQWVVKLNPFFYIIEGYRDSFINQIWFFQKPILSMYFWILIIVMLYFSSKVFNKMRPQFADVL